MNNLLLCIHKDMLVYINALSMVCINITEGLLWSIRECKEKKVIKRKKA